MNSSGQAVPQQQHELARLERLLGETFRALRNDRPNGTPVFALENGLVERDFDTLVSAVQSCCSTGRIEDSQSLCWAVYAAEIGYRFSGAEYWQTFERETPGWAQHGDRYWIRDVFQRFAQDYGGAEPSGKWAEHFGIICWPITHAVIPKDLQRHLVDVLFGVRGHLRSGRISSPAALGAIISAHSWNKSDRFRRFAEQHSLIGQVATALLLGEDKNDRSVLDPRVVGRIVRDISETARTLELLQIAQHSARSRTSSGGHKDSTSSLDTSYIKHFLQPSRRVLIPEGDDSWRLYVELPDTRSLLSSSPEIESILTKSRCVVAGTGRTSRPPGWILTSQLRVPVDSWLNSDETILAFSDADEAMQQSLNLIFQLDEGPLWVFKIHVSGCAYELRSRTLREGHEYLLVATEELACTTDLPGEQVQVSCEGVAARRVSSARDIEAAIRNLWEYGASLYMGVSCRPAGLPSLRTAADGELEWFSGLPCVLALSTPASVRSVVLSDEHEESWTFAVDEADDQQLLLQLDALSPGTHTYEVFGYESSDDTKPVVSESVSIFVRPRSYWDERSGQGTAIAYTVVPSVPTLEGLLHNEVALEVKGGRGRAASCTLEFRMLNQSDPLATKRTPNIRLPISARQWRSHMLQHVLKDNSFLEEHVLLADSCSIALDAAELGRFAVLCERGFAPIRWSPSREHGELRLELVDDTGSGQPVRVEYFSFASPLLGHEEQMLALGGQIPCNDAGGMYMASSGDYLTSIVVPAGRDARPDLARFTVGEWDEETGGSSSSTHEMLRQCAAWRNAITLGGYRTLFLNWYVRMWLVHEIVSSLCGRTWRAAEREFLRCVNLATVARLRDALETVRLGNVLRDTVLGHMDEIMALPIYERATALAHLTRKYMSCSISDQDADLSLRISSDPASVLSEYPLDWPSQIDRLRQRKQLVAAARFLVLKSGLDVDRKVGIDEIHPRWEWR